MSFLGPAAIALQVASSFAGGAMESKGLRREANALDESGRRDESQGAADAVAAYRESRLALGEDMAAMGGSGFAIGSGSAQDLLTQALVERELEGMNIRQEAHLAAEEKRAQAREKRRQAKGALFAGLLNGASAAVSGASQMRSDARAASRNGSTRAAARAGYGLSS